MTIIGYARVSTTDQDLEIQIAALKREGCGTIRSEKRSGTTTEGREELRIVLDFLRDGVRAMEAQGLGADRAGWRSPSILTVSELARNTVINSPLNTQEVSNGPDLSDPSTPPRGRDHLHPNHGVDADVPPNWREKER
jgi:hypothetical protein